MTLNQAETSPSGPATRNPAAPPKTSSALASYLLQPSPLLLLLLDPLLPLGQELPLVLLVLALLLLQLLPAQRLRALLVGQLQPQEIPPQRRLPGQVQDGAAHRRSIREDPLRAALNFLPLCDFPVWPLSPPSQQHSNT